MTDKELIMSLVEGIVDETIKYYDENPPPQDIPFFNVLGAKVIQHSMIFFKINPVLFAELYGDAISECISIWRGKENG